MRRVVVAETTHMYVCVLGFVFLVEFVIVWDLLRFWKRRSLGQRWGEYRQLCPLDSQLALANVVLQVFCDGPLHTGWLLRALHLPLPVNGVLALGSPFHAAHASQRAPEVVCDGLRAAVASPTHSRSRMVD